MNIELARQHEAHKAVRSRLYATLESRPRLMRQPLRRDWLLVVSRAGSEDRSLGPSISIVIRSTAAAYGVTRNDINSDTRAARVVRARQVAMWLGRRLTVLSLPQIGRGFGNKDHTTILHAVNKIDEMREGDPGFYIWTESLALIVGGFRAYQK